MENEEIEQEEDPEIQGGLDYHKQFPETVFRQLPIWNRHLASRLVASLFLAHERHNHEVHLAYMERYKTYHLIDRYDPSIENWEAHAFTHDMYNLQEREVFDIPLLKDSLTASVTRGKWDRTDWRNLSARAIEGIDFEKDRDVADQAIANKLEEYIFCYLAPQAQFFYLHPEYKRRDGAFDEDIEAADSLAERVLTWGLDIDTEHEEYSPMRANLLDRKYEEVREWLKDPFVQEKVDLVADFLYNDPIIEFFPDELDGGEPNEVHGLKVHEAHKLLLQWEKEKFGN